VRRSVTSLNKEEVSIFAYGLSAMPGISLYAHARRIAALPAEALEFTGKN
jgi:hypothetical protein